MRYKRAQKVYTRKVCARIFSRFILFPEKPSARCTAAEKGRLKKLLGGHLYGIILQNENDRHKKGRQNKQIHTHDKKKTTENPNFRVKMSL